MATSPKLLIISTCTLILWRENTLKIKKLTVIRHLFYDLPLHAVVVVYISQTFF